jgi:hypothetical protein
MREATVALRPLPAFPRAARQSSLWPGFVSSARPALAGRLHEINGGFFRHMAEKYIEAVDRRHNGIGMPKVMVQARYSTGTASAAGVRPPLTALNTGVSAVANARFKIIV